MADNVLYGPNGQRVNGKKVKRLSPDLGESHATDIDLFGGSMSSVDKALIDMIEGCEAQNVQTPRNQRVLSKLVLSVLPLAKRAIHDLTGLVGTPIVETRRGSETDPELNRACNDYLRNDLPILTEQNWTSPLTRGVDNFSQRTVGTMLRTGMAYVESRVKPGRGGYEGALIYKPDNFNWIFDPKNGGYQLQYLGGQYPDINKSFHLMGYDWRDEDGYVEAFPLLAGSAFTSKLLITILVAIRTQSKRKGAPSEIMIAALRDSEALLQKNSRTAYTETLSSLTTIIEDMAKKQASGQPSYAFVRTPVNMDLISKSFGVEGLQEIDKSIIELVMSIFASNLLIPPELFGIVLGAAGFSPERFRILRQSMLNNVSDIREKARPMTEAVCFDALLFDNVASASQLSTLQLGYNASSLVPDIEQAETERWKSVMELNRGNMLSILSNAENLKNKDALIDELMALFKDQILRNEEKY